MHILICHEEIKSIKIFFLLFYLREKNIFLRIVILFIWFKRNKKLYYQMIWDFIINTFFIMKLINNPRMGIELNQIKVNYYRKKYV